MMPRSIQKVSERYIVVYDFLEYSYNLSFQPSTFPLPDLWHAHRPNITLPEKFQTLFPCSHLFAFLNLLTGPGDRNFTEQQTAVAVTQWVTRALQRKRSVIFSLCIYSVSKCGTSCVLFYKIVLHLLITIIPIDPFTLLKHQHPNLIRISSTILRIHIIHTIMHTYKQKINDILVGKFFYVHYYTSNMCRIIIPGVPQLVGIILRRRLGWKVLRKNFIRRIYFLS